MIAIAFNGSKSALPSYGGTIALCYSLSHMAREVVTGECLEKIAKGKQ